MHRGNKCNERRQPLLSPCCCRGKVRKMVHRHPGACAPPPAWLCIGTQGPLHPPTPPGCALAPRGPCTPHPLPARVHPGLGEGTGQLWPSVVPFSPTVAVARPRSTCTSVTRGFPTFRSRRPVGRTLNGSLMVSLCEEASVSLCVVVRS